MDNGRDEDMVDVYELKFTVSVEFHDVLMEFMEQRRYHDKDEWFFRLLAVGMRGVRGMEAWTMAERDLN